MKQEFENARVKGFLHADGRRMVNGCGEEVLLRGWGMGNWRSRQYQQRIKDLQILQSVSYTHLTLPTNSLV